MNVTAGGATPLHIAADNGSPELINCLLKAGADPNVTDEVRLAFFLIFFCTRVYATHSCACQLETCFG